MPARKGSSQGRIFEIHCVDPSADCTCLGFGSLGFSKMRNSPMAGRSITSDVPHFPHIHQLGSLTRINRRPPITFFAMNGWPCILRRAMTIRKAPSAISFSAGTKASSGNKRNIFPYSRQAQGPNGEPRSNEDPNLPRRHHPESTDGVSVEKAVRPHNRNYPAPLLLR